MGRYRGVADHENRLLVEPEDETARIFYAAQDGEVVGTSRFSWGGDAPFLPRLIEHYRLAPFLAELPPEVMAVGERGMVAPRLRGSELFKEMGRETQHSVNDNRIQLVFGACEPHLLSLYIGQGCRSYSIQNINSPEAGYLVPIGRLRSEHGPPSRTPTDARMLAYSLCARIGRSAQPRGAPMNSSADLAQLPHVA